MASATTVLTARSDSQVVPETIADAIRAEWIGFTFRVPFALDAYRLGFSVGIREDYGYQADQYPALDLPVHILDNDFRDPDLKRYLAVFEDVQPRVGVIGDAFDADDARTLVDAARQLQNRLPAFEPLIVPKCQTALESIPEDIVVGYPIGYSEIQASDFSTPADWAGRRIHVLGGTPPTQWETIQDLTGCGHHGTTLAEFGVVDPEPQATIVGLDWNGLYRMATFGEFWHHRAPHWRPADHCSIRATVRRGLWHVRAFWRERGVWPKSTPVDDRGSDVVDGPLRPDNQICMGCGHRLREDEYELVEDQSGTVRAFCSEQCRSRSAYYNEFEPVAETAEAHHLWDSDPERWEQAL